MSNTQTSSSLKENDDVVGGIKLPQLEDEEDGIGIKEKVRKVLVFYNPHMVVPVVLLKSNYV